MSLETTTPVKPDECARILYALSKFIRQRSGIDPRNYISHGADDAGRKAYRAEARSITRDYQHARALLAVLNRLAYGPGAITAEDLKSALTRAYSGRLSWDGESLHYCTGQYFPTEYRRAVCAVATAVLWDRWREEYAAERLRNGVTFDERMHGARDFIVKRARFEFGRGIASRWFN